jgi:hypothetical protein
MICNSFCHNKLKVLFASVLREDIQWIGIYSNQMHRIVLAYSKLATPQLNANKTSNGTHLQPKQGFIILPFKALKL